MSKKEEVDLDAWITLNKAQRETGVPRRTLNQWITDDKIDKDLVEDAPRPYYKTTLRSVLRNMGTYTPKKNRSVKK